MLAIEDVSEVRETDRDINPGRGGQSFVYFRLYSRLNGGSDAARAEEDELRPLVALLDEPARVADSQSRQRVVF